jgi:hypothetical protein
MIRALLVAAVIAAATAYQAASLTTSRHPVAAPVSDVIDRSGTRILLPKAKLLDVAGAAGPAHSIKSLLNVPGRIGYGEFVWDDRGVADGPVWVFVDLTAQTMSVFRGNHEIGAAVLLYGAEELPTPTGRFTVLRMNKEYWSRSYDAPMPYSLWLTEDGVAIHGSDVRPGAATHGCVGVPPEFAKRLFGVAKVGAEVFITRPSRLIAEPA